MRRRLPILPLVLGLLGASPGCEAFEPSSGAAGDGGGAGGGAGGGSSGGGTPPGDGGAGTVEVLASGLANPMSLVVAGTSLYWIGVARVAEGTVPLVHRCDVDGCKGAPARLLEERAFRIATDGKAIYWTGGTSIRTCDVGATCAPRTLFDGSPSVGLLAHAAGSLYFSTGTVGSQQLQTCLAADCVPAAPLWASQAIGDVVFTGDDVYFTSGTSPVELVRYRRGQAASIGSLPGLPTYLAARDPNVYVVTRGQLFRCEATSSCTLVPFTTQETRVSHVVVEGDAVYYSVFARGGVPGGIFRCGLDDCSAPAAVVTDVNPRELRVAGDWIYFADQGDESAGGASVRRVRR